MPATTRERNLLEAFLHGCAMLLVAVTATLAVVLALMLACGCTLDGEHFLMVPTGLLAAGSVEFLARLARIPA
jgi:hypothetical protein